MLAIIMMMMMMMMMMVMIALCRFLKRSKNCHGELKFLVFQRRSKMRCSFSLLKVLGWILILIREYQFSFEQGNHLI